ncbi:MAG: hypothetical protein P9F75_09275 [Candidatus Contendobacter sp.]|nr:hypothetical protein [Candidatus Contendobacter sp.]
MSLTDLGNRLMTREDDTGYSAWAPLKRARRGLPQDELSIWEIATTTFPEDAHEERKDLTNDLIQAIKAGRLAAYGNPEGWYARVSRLNQQPLSMRIRNRDSIMNLRPIALGEQWERCNLHEGTRIIRGIWKGFRAIFDDTDFHGDNCLIRRADYLAFLDLPQRAWIPKPDWWKAPQDESAPLPQGKPDRPEQGAAAKRETELQMHRRECQEIGKRLWAENPNSTKADIMKHRDMLFYVQAYKGKNTVPGWLAKIDPRPKDKRRGRPKKIPV